MLFTSVNRKEKAYFGYIFPIYTRKLWMKKTIILVLFTQLTSESLFWSYLYLLDLETVKTYVSVFYIFNVVFKCKDTQGTQNYSALISFIRGSLKNWSRIANNKCFSRKKISKFSRRMFLFFSFLWRQPAPV